jgi:hypothetical protein
MQATRGNLTLEIHQDLDAENPRTCWDGNAGTMACWHNRYTLGDVQPQRLSGPAEWLNALGRQLPDALVLPLYLLDHSGLRISTTPFSCPWDSGQVGWIYTTPARFAELGLDWDPERARRELLAEVETYGQYLAGDVYGFRLLENGEEISSCWGFFGTDWATNGLTDHLPDEARALLEVLE